MVVELLKRARSAWEQAVHPWRRAQALSRLRRRGRPRVILMICQGNICRSPFAARILARAFPPRTINIISAGLMGPGRPSPSTALEVAARRGVDLTTHRSRLVTPDLLARADLVIVMDGRQRAVLLHDYRVPADRLLVLGDMDPDPITARTILDPIDRPAEDFERTYARIERCVEVLATRLAAVVTDGAAAAAAGVESRRQPLTKRS